MNMTDLHQQAMAFHQSGNLGEAEKLYLQILACTPQAAATAHLLGILRLQQGRNDEALALIGQARASEPGNADMHTNYGYALKQLGRKDEALACFAAVLAAHPGYAGAAYNRAILLQEMKRFDEALESYQQAAMIRPDFADAIHDQAHLLQSLNRRPEALAAFDRLLALRPGYAEGWSNRGVLLQDMQRYDEALASLDRALAIQPGFAQALVNRGNALTQLHRYGEALTSFDRALALGPVVPAVHAKCWSNRGILLQDMKRYAQAMSSFSNALALTPDDAGALHLRGKLAWMQFRDFETASRDLERAASLDPARPFLLGDLAYIKMHLCDWHGRDEDIARLNDGVRAGKPVVEPFTYQALSTDPADLQTCNRLYARLRHPAEKPLHSVGARRPGRIRVGYVSGEFCEQATAFLMAGLYECHDKSRFEITAFDNGSNDDSPMRKRLESAFEHFVDIAGMSDRAAAEKIVRSDIDILVNLNGYFGQWRTGIFAHHPAPVQVNYLGFPATLGAPYMDYIIADALVIPQGEEEFYDEKVVRLPGSYQVNDSKREIAQEKFTRADCGLAEGAFIFCNFNQSYKIAPETFAGWMRILQACPGSVLWLLENHAQTSRNLREAAAAAGVAPERLVFAPVMKVEKHLARLKLADLCLDSLPYNAHTTASDALWAGVPLLTRRGTAFAGRVAASLLNAIGLPELICEDQGSFERVAIRLAGAADRMRDLKEKLARNRGTTALFDTAGFTLALEAAYTQMVERH